MGAPFRVLVGKRATGGLGEPLDQDEEKLGALRHQQQDVVLLEIQN